MTLNFDQVVNLPANPADAFQLVRQSDGITVSLTATVASNVTTQVLLTFPGSGAEPGSLADGRYTLTIPSGLIFNVWGALDGDANGAAGGVYVLACVPSPNPPTNIYRLFGDSNGDGTVNGADFLAFRLAFLQQPVNLYFDYDGDGQVERRRLPAVPAAIPADNLTIGPLPTATVAMSELEAGRCAIGFVCVPPIPSS